MRLELKFLVAVASIVVIGLTSLNIINFYFINKYIDTQLYIEGLKSYKLYKLGEPIPDYIIISQNLIKEDTSYRLIDFIDGVFLYYKTSYKWKKLLRIFCLSLGAEILILAFSLILVHKLINMYSSQKEEFLKITELILLALSHKLGNALSSFKINLEILKSESKDNHIIERMLNQYKTLEEHFRILTAFLEMTIRSRFFTKKARINLKILIEDIVWELLNEDENKNVKVYGSGLFKLNANKSAINLALYLILENAFKYSKDYIRIKICNKSITVVNDVKPKKGGMGVGIAIAEKILDLYNLRLKYKHKGNTFITVISRKFHTRA